MDKRLLGTSVAVLGVGALAALIVTGMRSREPATSLAPDGVPAPSDASPQVTPQLSWVKKSQVETGPVTTGDSWRMQGSPSTTPQSTGWGAIGQGLGSAQNRPQTEEERQQWDATLKAMQDQSVQRMKQAMADVEARRVAEAQQAELLVRQAEAQRIADAQAELARLAREQAQAEQAVLGGDPNTLAFFETSGTRGTPNLTVCNESSYRIKVGVVRTNQAYLGLWGSPWIADGFHALSSGCRSFSFGLGKALSNGYISIFQENSSGRWESLTYGDREPNSAMKATLGTHSRWICWPESATAVDPSVDCPDSNRNVLFGLDFGTSGHVVGFTITVTDDGISQHVRQY